MNTKTHIDLSIDQSFKDQNILVAGVSGFLGKVWLSMFLKQDVPFKHLFLMIRPKGNLSGRQRFVEMVHKSFAFEPWFEEDTFDRIQKTLNNRITVLEGDISKENLGLSAYQVKQLQTSLDLLINISGLVDFRAPLESSYKVNVQGTIHSANFISSCQKAKLVHVSTCYVAGESEGAIEEKVQVRTPKNQDFDPQKEIQWIEYAVTKVKERYNGKEKVRELTNFLRKRNEKKGKNPNIKQFQRTLEQLKSFETKNELVNIGAERAQALGFTNTYTYTKALAELILVKQYPNLDYTIVRPSIVESSHHYPFAGWNEGFNTSGPLAYLLKGWFRYFPAEEEHPFDVIPVDLVVKGLTIASAALLNKKSKSVYQISTSHVNPFTIGEACQLCSSYYEQFYRKTGKTFIERHWKHRKTIATLRDHVFSSKNLFNIFSNLEKHCQSVDDLPKFIQKKLKPLRSKISITRKKLEQAENLLSIFKPFTRDFVQIYLSKNVGIFEVKEKFWQYDVSAHNWENYWTKAQMPGLQKWCFPFIEGKSVPTMEPKKQFEDAPLDSNMEAVV